jgi:hypothetical protein
MSLYHCLPSHLTEPNGIRLNEGGVLMSSNDQTCKGGGKYIVPFYSFVYTQCIEIGSVKKKKCA